jgi:hypothetical protein
VNTDFSSPLRSFNNPFHTTLTSKNRFCPYTHHTHTHTRRNKHTRSHTCHWNAKERWLVTPTFSFKTRNSNCSQPLRTSFFSHVLQSIEISSLILNEIILFCQTHSRLELTFIDRLLCFRSLDKIFRFMHQIA